MTATAPVAAAHPILMESEVPVIETNRLRTPIRVGVGAMPPVMAEGLRAWLEPDPRLLMLGAGADPGGADVLVLDPGWARPGRRPGPGVPAAIRALASGGVPVVAFCPAGSPDVVRAVLRAGARAVVTQNQDRARLLRAIVAAAGNRPVENRPEGARPGEPNGATGGVPRLSEQEGLVLAWWLPSMTKASVARRMGISAHTVDMYIRRIREKYASVGRPVPTKADLLLRAMEDGFYVA